MGNNQSTTQNTNKKIKVFKIIETQGHSDWTRAYLNDNEKWRKVGESPNRFIFSVMVW